MSKLYIAFGSNLYKTQMPRCPTARPLGKFMFAQCRLVFRGVADLEYDPESQTPCGLWAINKEDERSLDGYEGVNSGVYFKSEQTITYLGEKRKALVYLMNSDGIYPPSDTYVKTIRRGYKDFGMDESFLDAAVARSFQDKKPDHMIAARRRRQISGSLHRKLVENPNQEPVEQPGLFSEETP
jgi:hypothetical protein